MRIIPTSRFLSSQRLTVRKISWPQSQPGPTGYIVKTLPAAELAETIRAVAAGRSPLPPTLTQTFLSQFTTLMRAGNDPSRKALGLTAREKEVLGMLARGYGNREISTKLFISENTVKNHVRNVLDKLGARSRMEAVVKAAKRGLITLE